MDNGQQVLGRADASHTPTTDTQRVPVNIRTCNKNVLPADTSILGRCEYYYRPLHDEYVKKSGVSTWEALKAWASRWNPWDDVEVVRKLIENRDKLLKASTDGSWSRHANFMVRHIDCGHQPPAYYVSYGYYYCSIYGAKLYPRLSSAGKNWLVRARFQLQANMEDGLADNMIGNQIEVPCARYPARTARMTVPRQELELDNAKFKTFAFKTHVPAYLDGGLPDLPITDLNKIGGQPNIEEWLDKETWQQAIESGMEVVKEKVERAGKAVEHALKALTRHLW